MAKITAEQLQEADGWSQFAKRLGWEFESVAHGWCVMSRMGQPIKLNIAMREDIERTWRDREGQPKVQPVNVAKIGGA